MKHQASNSRKYSPIFVMILWLNLLSITVISVFNYFVFHRMNNRTYLEHFVDHNDQMTKLALHNIDKQIMMSVYSIPQIYFSPQEENHRFLDPQEKDISASPEQLLALTAGMHKIQAEYPYVKSIDIYYEGTGISVTGFDKIHIPGEEELLNKYLPWLQPWKENKLQQGFVDYSAAYVVSEPVLTYVTEISQAKWNGSSIYLAIHLSKQVFQEYISEQDGSLAILTKDHQIIYETSSDQNQGKLLSANEVLEKVQKQNITFQIDGEPITINGDGISQTVFYIISQDTGLLYLYQVADSSFYAEYHTIKHMFLIGYLISIVFNLLILIWITYYNNTAYRKRIQQVSKRMGITIEQTDSFEGTLQDLSNEIRLLHHSIDSSSSLLFQSAVRAMFFNETSQAIHEKLQPYMKGNYVCTAFLTLTENDFGRLSVENLQEQYAVGSRFFEIMFTTMENSGLVAVITAKETTIETAKQRFFQEMQEYYPKCHIVFGKNCLIEMNGVRESYLTVMEAAKYHYLYRENSCIFYETLHLETRKNHGSHLKLLDIIEKDIVNGQMDDLKNRMDELIVALKNGNYEISYCMFTLRDLVGLFYQIILQNQLDTWVVFGYDIREYYKQIPDIETFGQWSIFLCQTIIQTIQMQRGSVDIKLKEMIIRIIDENLETSISLDFLADELHMRPDAVSRLFKRIMGKGFAEYIKEQKLHLALQLMSEGFSVKEIAEQLGYSSSQYFIKVFKETYGTTPNKYRKQMKHTAE